MSLISQIDHFVIVCLQWYCCDRWYSMYVDKECRLPFRSAFTSRARVLPIIHRVACEQGLIGFQGT
jgi:hypothetical protein